MRVLTEGKPWCVEFSCTGHGNGGGGCKAKLEAERDDLRWFAGTDYPIYRDDAVVAKCPSCGVLTDISRPLWPPHPDDLQPFSTAWAKEAAAS